jgi:Protein of unknown function (DUF2568)
MSARGVAAVAAGREQNRGMARRVAPSPPGLPAPLVGGLLGVRFASELALLAGAAWAAGSRVHSTPLAALLGVVAALVVASVWAVWVAPKSTRRLGDPWRLALEFVLFVLVSVALWTAHALLPALLLAVVGLATAVAVRTLIPTIRA